MKKLLSLLGALTPAALLAQNEEGMYADGKIYVVVAVIGIIFAGLALYLFRLDKRIQKLENEK